MAIPEAKTMFRGTFRYKNWCDALDLLKALHLISDEKRNIKGKTFAQITAEINDLDPTRLKEAIKTKFGIQNDHEGLKAIEWLGVLDEELVHLEEGSTFDLTSDLMIKKMMMDKSERDMVIMQHTFNIITENGEKEIITSRMVDYGTKDYTSIARTVALPAAIGVKMIVEGRIKDTGVHIPIKKTIYAPILKELEKLGISMTETIEKERELSM